MNSPHPVYRTRTYGALGAFLLSCALLLPGAASATAAPTLLSPANGQTDWLFDNGSQQTGAFTWQPIAGATYRIVVSNTSSFSGFSDQLGNSTCDATCVTFATTATSANARNLAGFWWFGSAPYYWRVRASTPTGGTSDWSPVRSFRTNSVPGLITTALSYFPNSPQSIVGSTYHTDVYNSDGNRLRNAVAIFKAWVDTQGYTNWINAGRPSAPSNVRRSMINAISATYTETADQGRIIERIRTSYQNATPTTDQGILDFFGIRAQCKEFVDRVMLLNGLSPKYTWSTETNLVKPGMYAFWRYGDHTALVRAVKFDAGGARQAYVIEANRNYNGAISWSNPPGQVPWSRTVTQWRPIDIGPGTAYKAVASH